ncbi:uncharacterized protein IL334_004868 [Kwoniella shivajii]|uniref:RecF/RecN/SMC N-terminal domain-containing protein n=1 Tax=Kwoniella shivajii TaxID=564305 RepID=A0ABZ1D3F8_9TREE|nr:hypothetical protein IL334_004868 [Kwoniella shivajii]
MARAAAKRPSPSQETDGESSQNARAREIKRVKRETITERTEFEDGSSPEPSSDEDSLPDLEDAAMSDDEDDGEDYEEPAYKDDILVKAYEASKQRQKGYIGATSKAGVLKSMNLVDFMCHRHLSVDFEPKMNFLVGHNGSGKSALLTAIAVALGGKAMTTGRGQGLKDLIRKGADKAVITVVMANSGPEAFKPDIYDPHIIIERTISLNGSSGYKFRATRDGRTVANKRAELTAICENFSINIDSPLTILTQDQARSFLQSSDPHKMYKFFLNGTQLSSLLETYESSTQNIRQIENFVKRQLDAIPDLKEKVETLNRKLVASEAVVKQKLKYKKVLNAMAWAYVTEKENERGRYENIVRENDEKIDQAQTEIHIREKTIIQLADKIRETEKDITNLDQSRKPLQKAVQDAKDKVKNEKRDLNEADITAIKEDIDAEKGGLKILQGKIDAKLRMNVDTQKSEHAKAVGDRTKYEELIAKLRKEKPRRQQQYVEKSADLKAAKRDVQEVQYRIDQQNSTARGIQDKINNLETQSVNRLSAFGQGLDNVMRDIQRTKWRHSPPLGPLGMFVKLDDMGYRDIIQTILGQTLCSFAVQDNHDRSTLIQILQRHLRSGYRPGTGINQVPPVLLHHGDVFDFTRGDLSHLGPTFLSKLTVENEHVLRLLVTLHQVERTFLARTVTEANNEMKKMHNSRTLDNVRFFSADFQQLSGTISSKQSGPTGQWRGFTLFTRDLKDEVQRARNELYACNADEQKLGQEKQAALAKVSNLESELLEISKQVDKVSKGIAPAEAKLDETRRKLAEMSSTEMENWEADREDRMRKIQAKEDQLQGFLEDKRKRLEKVEEYNEAILARQRDLDAHAPERQKQAKTMTTLVQQRAEVDIKKKHYEKSMNLYQERKNAAAAQVVEYQEQVDLWIPKAQNFCATRVYSEKTSDQLTQEKNVLDASIKDAEQQLGVDTEHLASEIVKAKALLREVVESINKMNRLQRIFNQAIKTRRLWWAETRSHTAIRAKTAFVVFENLRDMDGRLDFDHVKERLSLIVHSTTRTENEEGESTQRSHYKTAKNLSGGERSFSTVSLLLALWSTVPCPIRALDEWDVFLDAANRKVAAKSLMDGARESDGKQFVLITPQDMSGIEVNGPDTKVIRLADPNRNQ